MQKVINSNTGAYYIISDLPAEWRQIVGLKIAELQMEKNGSSQNNSGLQ